MEAKIAIIILLVRFSQQMIVLDKVDPVNRAISDLVKRQDQSNVDIITFGTQTFDDLISTVTSAHKGSIRFRILKANEKQAWNLLLNESSLLLFDSYEVYKKFAPKFDYCNPEVSARRRHIVYYPKTKYASFQTFPRGKYCMFWATFVIDSEENEWIHLTKLQYFYPGICRSVWWSEINSFSVSQLRWMNETFFTKDIKNFNNCPMNVGRAVTYERLTGIRIYEKFFSKQLLRSLEKSLNFTIVSDNLEHEIDFTIWLFYYIGKGRYEISRRFAFPTTKFIIAKGDIESPFNKFIKPFDKETWICIACSMIIGLLTIRIVSRFRRQVQNFVFGRDVTTPTLNMWLIFNGIGMITLPSRNFARFTLMLYIIFCLIVRTGYQGMLYEYLQQDFRIDDIHTIEDLLQRNFIFFVAPILMNATSDILKM